MRKMAFEKYKKYPKINLKDRKWPDNEITKAPIWCSVDLRDGNQSLVEPMNVQEKIEFFKLLLEVGFKEIEIGFPSASQIEYDFLRTLVDRKMIPDDVTIQVLTQARESLITKTFEALKGVKKAVVHLYNSTSTLQRNVVFKMEKDEIKKIAIEGTKLIKKLALEFDGEVALEYSPESFTGTELEYALEVCEAVQEIWQPTKDKKMIVNLPATVEMSTPNIYADQIEWMIRNFKDRESLLISLHTHNDRGTGVAATELAMLAGADRVEGTLFGNGERTGNVDIIAVALNLFSQGIDPELDFSNINKVINVYERCCKIPVHVRHPYAGKLVYTAFSGSHQDAINKGMAMYRKSDKTLWEVPYLPIDPADLGREYEALVRINSQSGKGGVAYIMEYHFGYKLPKNMHREFADIIQVLSERQGEIAANTIFEKFEEEYLKVKGPYKFISCKINESEEDDSDIIKSTITIKFEHNNELREIKGTGNGPIDSLKNAFKENSVLNFKILSYNEHALEEGSDSKAASYIQIENENGEQRFGIGVDTNITIASVKAIFSALNRL